MAAEFLPKENAEDGLEELMAQLKMKFVKMRAQLLEFENSDHHRMETDRAVRARLDLKGVEEQVILKYLTFFFFNTVEFLSRVESYRESGSDSQN